MESNLRTSEIIKAELERLAKEFGPPKNEVEKILCDKRLFNIRSEDVIYNLTDNVLTTIRKKTVEVVVGQIMKYKSLDPAIVEKVVRQKLG